MNFRGGSEEQVVLNISGYEVLISLCDVEKISSLKWCVSKHKNQKKGRPYFQCSILRDGKYTTLRLHRLIMNCPVGFFVDHINGNTLDNRRDNLRICTHAENMRNRFPNKNNPSGYKGVSWYKRQQKWRSQIRVDNKKIHLGYFNTPEEAYLAYCNASKKYHQEFGRVAV
jgi:hypothetical protein